MIHVAQPPKSCPSSHDEARNQFTCNVLLFHHSFLWHHSLVTHGLHLDVKAQSVMVRETVWRAAVQLRPFLISAHDEAMSASRLGLLNPRVRANRRLRGLRSRTWRSGEEEIMGIYVKILFTAGRAWVWPGGHTTSLGKFHVKQVICRWKLHTPNRTSENMKSVHSLPMASLRLRSRPSPVARHCQKVPCIKWPGTRARGAGTIVWKCKFLLR